MGHIFISYSHKDTAYAHRLAETLQHRGFEVWIDVRLDYGSQWPQEIQKQLDGCSAFILIMSHHAFASEWVQSELSRAKRKGKPIFPVLLEGDEPWLSVESTQFFDVRGGILPDEKFFRILWQVVQPVNAGQTLRAPSLNLRRQNTSSPRYSSGLLVGVGATIGVVCICLVAVSFILLRQNIWAYLSPTQSAQVTMPSAALLPPSSTIPSPVQDAPITLTPSLTLPVQSPPITLTPSFTPLPKIPMALIPAGTFTMGNTAEAAFVECEKHRTDCQLVWFADEEPPHQVKLEAFYLDVYEVTNSLYKNCVDAGVCRLPKNTDHYNNSRYTDHPVVHVDWNQAKTYCEWRGVRLPTEAEWEYAARGTDGRTYPWGEGIDKTFTNYDRIVGDTIEVGSYEKGKSPFGIYDMAGNVLEWVSDWYNAYPGNTVSQPDYGTDYKILRGGAWHDIAIFVRTAVRPKLHPADSFDYLGFRCARSATSP